ncbi:MAG: TraR/DksA family transcriptional regulator [Elusimicrobia bacterium]|nr:TraR/DksA family transcriptional regulator [Elusimicrobiota bacterium]
MKKTEIEQIRKELNEERDILLEEVKRVKERGEDYLNYSGGDEIDKALGNTQREMLFYLNDQDRVRLDSIEDALHKIDSGHYGVCESCRKKIQTERLKAIPWARFCINCKPVREKNL